MKVSGPAPSAFQLSLPPARAVMRRWTTGAAACLLLGAMAASGTGQVPAHGAKLYFVPTSSWRPGDPSLLALAMRTLAAGTYRAQRCVWLVANSGSGRAPIVWPAGFPPSSAGAAGFPGQGCRPRRRTHQIRRRLGADPSPALHAVPKGGLLGDGLSGAHEQLARTPRETRRWSARSRRPGPREGGTR